MGGIPPKGGLEGAGVGPPLGGALVLAATALAGLVALGLGCRDAAKDLPEAASSPQADPCPGCPDCGPDGSCEPSFCRPASCSDGRCSPVPGPCSDGDPHTWDRCDEGRSSCSAYLRDGARICSQGSDCATDHPCQRFLCVDGSCRLTEDTRSCGDALERPVVCRFHEDCARHVLWELSHPEKALVTLSGGPWCVTQRDGGRFCQWLDPPHGEEAEARSSSTQSP